MNLTFECPGCRIAQCIELTPTQQVVACPNCAHRVPIRMQAIDRSRVHECALCGTPDLYLQKDFPHRLGSGIVIVGSVLSCIAWWQYWYPTALAILLVAAALDMCLYYAIGDVLICYRCLAQYRGAEKNPAHKAFDLGVGERYRQERIRLQLLRRDAGAAGHDETSPVVKRPRD